MLLYLPCSKSPSVLPSAFPFIGQGPLANSACFDIAKHHGQGALYLLGPLRTIKTQNPSRDPGGSEIRAGHYNKPYTSISGVSQEYWGLQCLGVQTRVGIISGPKQLLGLWVKCPLRTVTAQLIVSAFTVHTILLPAMTIPQNSPSPGGSHCLEQIVYH